MRRSEKIFYDLTESNEFVELLESRFYFSSSFNKERFLGGYESYIKEEEDKIIAKYGVSISIRFYLLIAYYLKIEKRGFYIKRYSEKTKDYTIILERNYITFTEIEV
nr:MAG TPA: Phi-29-like late genes activator (early protein GP4) [Caudoviricetes sp.]